MTSRLRTLALLFVGAFLSASAVEFVVHDLAGTEAESACVICQVAQQPGTTAPTIDVPERRPTVGHALLQTPVVVSLTTAVLVDAPSRAPPG